ncbi:MAG: CPXCG motif-containing cysteine-rich protein [Ignavibacteriae bacterium]|nr:CPXCG motif-containing cysteine-rich protein [Ignavibacteriota bacterium]
MTYACASCGEENEVFVDHTAGSKQQFVEDCVVCCRPNVLRIHIDETGAATVEAEYEG